MVRDTTLAHKGLAPYKLISYLSVSKDAHAGHTHRLISHGDLLLDDSLLLSGCADKSPIFLTRIKKVVMNIGDLSILVSETKVDVNHHRR
jgi:hypothetical protein